MTPSESLIDDVDERLYGLFDDDPVHQRSAVFELIERAPREPDLEEALVEALEMSFEHWNDTTQATFWVIVILGEIGLDRVIPLIAQGLSVDDEVLVAASTRALRRIGEDAFTHLLEELRRDNFEHDGFVAALHVLEGVRAHDAPGTREVIEAQLTQFVAEPSEGRSGELRAEAAALSLARLGHTDARSAIERLHNEVYRRRNAFLQEALDLIDEYPEGVPTEAELSWDDEFRWALGDPGGDVRALFEEEDDSAI
ncbi:MAG: hypothetical protein AAF488_16740 [Planctomycetota bacterium]